MKANEKTNATLAAPWSGIVVPLAEEERLEKGQNARASLKLWAKKHLIFMVRLIGR